MKMRLILHSNKKSRKKIDCIYVIAGNEYERTLLFGLKLALKHGFPIGKMEGKNFILFLYSDVAKRGAKVKIQKSFGLTESSSKMRRFISRSLVAKEITKYNGKTLPYGGILVELKQKALKHNGILYFLTKMFRTIKPRKARKIIFSPAT